jgi:transcription initiation factor IIF auxiliary subunit
MAIKIDQGFEYKGRDWWKWWIWIDGTDEELDEIDHVTYTLHPTFPSPIVTTYDRNTNYGLENSGWGTFRIHARAVKKNREEIKLHHDLVLKYPQEPPNRAKER